MEDDTLNYTSFSDQVINDVALDELMESKEYKNGMNMALEALKMNILLFPNSTILIAVMVSY